MTTLTNDKPEFLATSRAAGTGRAALWAGRVLSGLSAAMLGLDASMKLFQLPAAVKGTVELGYPASVVFTLGLLQLVCLVLYLVPRTAVLGALLWTAYLGGAVATHVRVQNPLFSHVLSGVYVAIFLWGGLYLRLPQLRALLFPSKPR
ncbi:MAG: DoxX family protein [Pseudomonadota bacterium]